jgi:hypothetical protein
MEKLFGVAAIIISGLILPPSIASVAGVAHPPAAKAQVSEKSLIVRVANARRECRDDDGNSRNCAR